MLAAVIILYHIAARIMVALLLYYHGVLLTAYVVMLNTMTSYNKTNETLMTPYSDSF